MMRFPSISLLAAGLFALATGCSSPQESATTAGSTAAAAPAAAERSAGTRADSLGGIPGHKFGEPLSAFAGLKVISGRETPGGGAYQYPDGKGEPGWFGKRKKEMPGGIYSIYVFREGKFVAFQAMAYGDMRAALQEQAVYLFGPGKQWPTGTTWEGKQVLAWAAPANLPLGAGVDFNVQSQDYVKALAQDKANKLKAENAL